MSILRFLAIIAIFGAVTAAWMILGGSVWYRTHEMDRRFSAEMAAQWGPEVVAQAAPYWAPQRADGRSAVRAVAPAASAITAHVVNDHRHKGLLWYSTFTVAFEGLYTVPPTDGAAKDAAGFFIFPLPRGATGYDGPAVAVDDVPVKVPHADIRDGRIAVPLDRQAAHTVKVAYKANGQNLWLYCPADAPANPDRWDHDSAPVVSGGDALAELNDFSLTVTTNFADIDFPASSPTAPAADADGGRKAVWTFDHAVTSQIMGVAVPKKPNPGPIVWRMALFAPVSLFFFFTVLFATVVLRRIALHPMHYLFISAGFFAFHILLAYLVDLVNLHAAFWICSAVSVFLVVTYMRLVAGVKFAVGFVAAAQLVYLVGFSYAFFWKGRTGLTITIAAIVTLFALMQATGRVNWFGVLKGRRAESAPPGEPPPP